ncbi:MAG: hypothetical protein AAB538_04170, partial [Patescibacteria group bacterium]
MSLLSDEAAIEKNNTWLHEWFKRSTQAPALLIVGEWEGLSEGPVAALPTQDRYLLETSRRSISIEDIRNLIRAS